MTRHPFHSSELGRDDPEMDRIADTLERYADATAAEPPIGLATRIRDVIDDQPRPAGGWWASVLAALTPLRGPARIVLAAAVVIAAVMGAIALGELADRAPVDTGTTPPPSVVDTPVPTPTPTVSPTPSPTPQPSASAAPTASDDDDELDTPDPTETDGSSGPGSGGSDNSGPGGSGSDNSGPGGG